MSSVADNLRSINEAISSAASAAKRDAGEITLIAVSKTKPIELLHEAIEAGQLVFGENYLQEAEAKVLELRRSFPDLPIRVHMIGRLQSNKLKRAVGLFDVIETIDRLEAAEVIGKVARAREIEQEIFIQVNISNEESKSGVMPSQALELVKACDEIEGVRVSGLMCIGTFFTAEVSEELRRGEFRKMRELRDDISAKTGIELKELSMGMSDDFHLAIAEGASIVRVGSAIFGARQ